MRREIEKLHEEWEKSGTPLLDFRIGLHTGWAATGNMGSEILFDYTALGDTVNLGSRLEGANKVYGTKMMISEPTREQAGDKIVTRRLDSIIVKGKEEPIAVYELIGRRGEVADEKIKLIEKYERAFELYSQREFEQAHELFGEILSEEEDPPSRVFLEKTEELLDNPPAADWQPVNKLTSK
jgi:adenylate cyclase